MTETNAFSNHNVPFFKRRYTLKQSYKFFIISFFTGILLTMVYDAVNRSFTQMWKEDGFAYDVKGEYYTAGFSGGIRKWLVHFGWDDDGFIPSLLHRIHRKAYVNAMEKIPEGDGERELWYFNYKIYPEIQNNNTEKLDSVMSDVVEKYNAHSTAKCNTLQISVG